MTVNVDVNLRSPIAAIIGGLGSAVGGIGNAIGGAANLAADTIETIGNIAKAGSAAGGEAPDKTVNQENLGLLAAAAQESVKGKATGGGTLPAPRTATKQAPSQNLSTQKLLTIAVKHLESIDATLKSQLQYNVEAAREEAIQQKENEIEGKNNVFTRFADRMKMKAGSAAGTVKEKTMGFAQTAAMIAGAALLLKLSTLKPETIEKLKKSIDTFYEKFKFFFEDVFPILSAAFLGANLGKQAGPWGAFIGAVAGGLIAWGWGLGEKAEKEIAREKQFQEERTKTAGQKIGDALDAYGAALQQQRVAQAEASAMAGTPGEVESQQAVGEAMVKVKKAKESLVKSMKDAGYSDEQIKSITDIKFEDKKQLLEQFEKIGDPANPPKQADATPASQTAGAIPDVAYDIVLGHGKFGRTEDYFDGKKLTQLTVAEVMQFGKNVLQPNSKAAGLGRLPSGELVGDSGVGAFSTNRTTLKGAIAAGIIKPGDVYDKAAQEKVAKWVYDTFNKQSNLNNAFAYFNKTGTRTSGLSFEENKYNIAQGEVGAYAGMTGSGPVAQTVGSGLTALGEGRQALVGLLDQKLARRDADQTQKLAVDQKANEIRENAKKLEDEMRGAALKEEKRKTEVANMSPGAMLAKANQGKLEAIDPNYRTDPNSIISKYFVHFGLAA